MSESCLLCGHHIAWFNKPENSPCIFVVEEAAAGADICLSFQLFSLF